MSDFKRILKDGLKVGVWKHDWFLFRGLVKCFVNKTNKPNRITFLNLKLHLFVQCCFGFRASDFGFACTLRHYDKISILPINISDFSKTRGEVL